MTTHRLSAALLAAFLSSPLVSLAQTQFPITPAEPTGLPGAPPAALPASMPTITTLRPAAYALPNPALEQAIVRTLRESGKLAQYRIHVVAVGTSVSLTGEVADESQLGVVKDLLSTVPGIGKVHDWIQVRPSLPSYIANNNNGIMTAQGPVLQPLPGPVPAIDGAKERIDGHLPEPTPIFQAPPGPNPMMQPPPLPPYAWPTFAPYNNYSRVAYPNAYPYEQWPFIGPIYPFPRVPLGWRSVSLTWEDGHWWYYRNPTGHDWWRIRYH